jgi:hypothetical protein
MLQTLHSEFQSYIQLLYVAILLSEFVELKTGPEKTLNPNPSAEDEKSSRWRSPESSKLEVDQQSVEFLYRCEPGSQS